MRVQYSCPDLVFVRHIRMFLRTISKKTFGLVWDTVMKHVVLVIHEQEVVMDNYAISMTMTHSEGFRYTRGTQTFFYDPFMHL